MQYFQRIRTFHMIGIGGISMSALAKFLLVSGYRVQGSDLMQNRQTAELKELGALVYVGHRAQQVQGADVVVCSSAIAEDNPELLYARSHGIQIYSRVELLHIVSYNFCHTVAVAGSHGKTTATAMFAHVLHAASCAFTLHLGGEDSTFGNFYYGGEDYFVTEACEYKKNLLHLRPEYAILLNVDADHMECYRDRQDLCDTFAQFCASSQGSAVCGDDPSARVMQGVTFGMETICDYMATKIRQSRERYSFTVREYGRELFRLRLATVGRHQIYNALAVIAVAKQLRISDEAICRGLERFTSVKRRFEKIGSWRGADFVCDYAHHPRELTAVLRTAGKRCKRELKVIFQPHTYSRTRLLFEDFVAVLSGLSAPVIYRTYAAREEYDESGSARTLSQAVPNSLYMETERELKTYLETSVRQGDLVLFLGAGDIYEIAKRVLRELKG